MGGKGALTGINLMCAWGGQRAWQQLPRAGPLTLGECPWVCCSGTPARSASRSAASPGSSAANKVGEETEKCLLMENVHLKGC